MNPARFVPLAALLSFCVAAFPALSADVPDNSADPPSQAIPAAPPAIPDPIEPVNRALFVFNDRAYLWVLKPLGKGYDAIVPEPVRTGVRNVFSNLATPVRVANNLLSGRLRDTGVELLRFTINSTLGMGGFFDAAGYGYDLHPRERDLGLTLGGYGVGHGAFLILPILGPSSLRDTVGLAGDTFLDPLTYVKGPETSLELKGFRIVNGLTPTIGKYESLTGEAIDPYAAVRDAYAQRRWKALDKSKSGLH